MIENWRYFVAGFLALLPAFIAVAFTGELLVVMAAWGSGMFTAMVIITHAEHQRRRKVESK